MRKKPYYSVRTKKHPTAGRFDLTGLRRLLLTTFRQFEKNGYFQQAFGFDCIDAGFVAGSVGTDVEAFFFRKLKKENLWPLHAQIDRYLEDDVFDVIEVLHDCVSKGIDGYNHTWGECGWHYETFDKQAGQNDFRVAMNEILREYDTGYQLTLTGEIVVTAPVGLADIETAPMPPGDPKNVQARVSAAIDKFRHRGSSLDERREAIRNLADVLEYLRPRAKKVLNSKDETELFSLANNFGIRHHNQQQKIDYDVRIWYSWMFYYYLATIHALTRLIEKADKAAING